jgi:hypothetical protein
MRVTRLVLAFRVEVLLETEDGLEAEVFVHDWYAAHPQEPAHLLPHIEGAHASHRVDRRGGKCEVCGAPDNGCFAIHLPCGEPRHQGPFIERIEAWKEAHR